MRWLCASLGRWALGAGLLVSFTAAAGVDPQAGVSAASRALGTRPGKAFVDAGGLIPRSVRFAAASPSLPASALGVVREAALSLELAAEAEALAVGTAPRGELKQESADYPEVGRARKGDPLVSLRPTLSRRARELRDATARLLFQTDERALPPTVIMLGPVQGADPETMNALEPWRSDESTVTTRATSAQSPTAAAAGSTGSGRGSTTPSSGGSTPAVPRAVSLSSTTPAPADATPVEIAAAPVSPPSGAGMSLIPRLGADRPRYADLVNPDHLAREQRCHAEAVYFEARSEPAEGQAAVAQVVLNRVKSGLYPSTVCGVVYQNRHRHLACQFTFACEGKALRVSDSESWERARRVAREVLEGKTYVADVGGATHYHADYVRPRWSRRLKKMDVIGRHIFYKLKPGQT